VTGLDSFCPAKPFCLNLLFTLDFEYIIPVVAHQIRVSELANQQQKYTTMCRNYHYYWSTCKHSIMEHRNCPQHPRCPLQPRATALFDSPCVKCIEKAANPQTGLSMSSSRNLAISSHSTANTDLQVSAVEEMPVLKTFELFLNLIFPWNCSSRSGDRHFFLASLN
jgi:hypothetical protein